jgi:hypothetical protein
MEIWRFLLKFGQTMAIENLKQHLILALLVFNIAFLAIYIAIKKRLVSREHCLCISYLLAS